MKADPYKNITFDRMYWKNVRKKYIRTTLGATFAQLHELGNMSIYGTIYVGLYQGDVIVWEFRSGQHSVVRA